MEQTTKIPSKVSRIHSHNVITSFMCGDVMTGRGIGGYEQFRGDLRLMYFVLMDPATGKLNGLRMTPMRMKGFRVQRTSHSDAV